MTAYNFKEIYEQKDTDELLDIAQKQLTEEARVILNNVLSSRGISDSVIKDVHEEADKQAATLVTVFTSLASLWSRIFAFSIDVWGVMLALGIVLLPLRWVSADSHINAAVIFWLAYFLLRDSIPGQSIGKRVLGIKVVQLESGRPCNWGKSILRNITHFVFLIDALFILSQRNMRIGDMVAKTIVVKSARRSSAS